MSCCNRWNPDAPHEPEEPLPPPTPLSAEDEMRALLCLSVLRVRWYEGEEAVAKLPNSLRTWWAKHLEEFHSKPEPSGPWVDHGGGFKTRPRRFAIVCLHCCRAQDIENGDLDSAVFEKLDKIAAGETT